MRREAIPDESHSMCRGVEVEVRGTRRGVVSNLLGLERGDA